MNASTIETNKKTAINEECNLCNSQPNFPGALVCKECLKERPTLCFSTIMLLIGVFFILNLLLTFLFGWLIKSEVKNPQYEFNKEFIGTQLSEMFGLGAGKSMAFGFFGVTMLFILVYIAYICQKQKEWDRINLC